MIQQTHTVIVERSSHSGRIPELYNKLAGMYDLFTDHEPSHHKAAVQMAKMEQNDSILEVACGTGRATLEIAQQLKPDQIFRAVDLTKGMMSKAEQRLEKYGLLDQVDFRIADARRLPFPDSSFDVVYNAYMFDLIDISEFSVVLSEFNRVLKPGGRLVLVNMSKSKNAKTLYEWLYEKSLLNFASGSCRPVLLKSFVEEAGFKTVTRTYRRNYSWFFLNWLTGTEIVIGIKEL
jgi:demethylmenaquinone methyltransferase/2-methoxy-6-polyprenyl-1,4-benzoquinol methylase